MRTVPKSDARVEVPSPPHQSSAGRGRGRTEGLGPKVSVKVIVVLDMLASLSTAKTLTRFAPSRMCRATKSQFADGANAP